MRPIPGPGEVQGPILEFAPGTTDRDGLGGTFWRGFDFSPDGQWVVAVADADLVIAQRDLMNNVTSRIVIESNPTVARRRAVYRRSAVDLRGQLRRPGLHDAQQASDHGRWPVARRQRASSTTRPATQLSYALFDENGARSRCPTASVSMTSRGTSRRRPSRCSTRARTSCTSSSPSPSWPTGLCADQNGDGLVTPADFNAWILNFNNGDIRADTNQDGVVSPADFNAWILAFNGGANGPTCNP
jgi:hypothetical protein